MAESRRSEGENGRADLCVGDDLDAEDVCKPWATIVSKGAKNEVLALLIEDENP